MWKRRDTNRRNRIESLPQLLGNLQVAGVARHQKFLHGAGEESQP
jgi:hypothetical protein